MKKKLVIITGPTGIGKSSLAIKLCHEFNGSIIGCDSMQIYKGMDIGTGKVTSEEKENIEHYMLDVANPDEYFTVYDYVQQAKACINAVIDNGKLPFLVGGTGLYITGLLNGNNFAETSKDDKIRKELEALTNEKGLPYMYEYLKSIDKESADKISVNDKKRLLRALEIFLSTGKPKSQSATYSTDCEYEYLLFVITPCDRQRLYETIERRVDNMISQGLLLEVEKLKKYKNNNSMQAIGYKELIAYFDGKLSLENAIDKIKQGSRHYAKRQMTYFRRMPFKKIFIENNDDILQVMSNIIRERYE